MRARFYTGRVARVLAHLVVGAVAVVFVLNAGASRAQGTCQLGDIVVTVGPGNGNTYSPASVTINPGQTICWNWFSTFNQHSTTRTASPETWDSGEFVAPHAFRRGGMPGQFQTPGTFSYFCSFHGISMSGAVTVQAPTAVSLSTFAAARSPKGVLVRWRSATAGKTFAFDVYREQKSGKRVRLNHALILARKGVAAHSYSFLDRRAPQIAVRYWLQIIDINGSRTWHGPAVALDPPLV